MTSLHDIAESWLRSEQGGRIGDLIEQVSWLGRELYQDYEPYEYESFSDRLVEWLTQLDRDEDRQTLFSLLDHLFFVGRREFESLCRAAYNEGIIRWLIDCLGLAVDDPTLDVQLEAAIKESWFCSVTDSMRINAFLKVNGLKGQSHRPDFRSLAEFADSASVRAFMEQRKLKRIVLLEDFVGSGSQLEKPVKFAAAIDEKIQILVVPLVICPKGLEKGLELAAKHKNVQLTTVLELSQKLLVKPDVVEGEPEDFDRFRDLIERTKGKLSASNQSEPFGYRSTGALVVMYSNCPDNTLPIVHDDRGGWRALFPRIERE